jgi:hypothetical protein
MLVRLAIVGVALVALAPPAAATEWIYCSDNGGEASVDFLVGTLDVLAVAGLTMSAADRSWASHTAYGSGEPITVGQAFQTDDTLMIDAMDEALIKKVAELRLFRVEAADGVPIYGGTLRIEGVGAWAVTCNDGQ